MTRSDRVEALIRKESELETKLNLINAEIKAEQQALADATKKEKLYRECSELLVNTSLSIQRNTTEKIAKIVTDLYQYVFLSDDKFVIKVDTKRSVPVASFFIETKKNGKIS